MKSGYLVFALMVVTVMARGATTGARELTIELWATRPLSHLTVTHTDPPQKPLQVEWSLDGLHLSTGSVVKELALAGSFRIQANTTKSNTANDGTDLKEIRAAGKWNIVWQRTGLKLRLTLPSENYVMAALNGEAAPDEPMASLKAMAVSMRTYALVNADRHHAEGFGLCDNTHCQALRLEQVRPEIKRAVQETAGETLWFHGQRAHVYYTQHCGGLSEQAGSVWPAEQAPYLAVHRTDPYCLRRSAATWHARVPLTQLSEIFHAQGWHTPIPIATIRVTKKTASGRADLLEVTGQDKRATLSASSVRFAVDRAMGWNQLRSDWYTVTVTGDALEIDGKGYGHGVGLCQAGAHEMAAEGRSDAEILAFYFPGTHAGITPADPGWQRIAGSGWSLLTTTSEDGLLAEGNAVWNKAVSRMGATSPLPKPAVQELPSTELFRQTTGEPGWMLASTRGDTVYLQPTPVRRNNGGDGALLLHEFLHVLVEQQAGEKAPLWLREGLVEVLARNSGEGIHTEGLAAAEVDAMLAHPANALASRQAHDAAEEMTERLLAHYGMTTVRRFLREGVPASDQNGGAAGR